jgi:hypothetical protein
MEDQMTEEYLLLKWGTLKGWRFNDNNTAAHDAFHKYRHLNWSLGGAMTQEMTDEHKAFVCELIDACTGPIQSDWSGEIFTKDKAKQYIMEYR